MNNEGLNRQATHIQKVLNKILQTAEDFVENQAKEINNIQNDSDDVSFFKSIQR